MKRRHKRRKFTKEFKKFIKKVLLLIIFILLLIFAYKKLLKDNYIKNIYLEDNKLYVLFKGNSEMYCLLSNNSDEPSLDSNEWIKSSERKCTFDFVNDHYYLFIKKNNKIIYNSDKNKVLYFEFSNNNDKYYAVNSEYNLKYDLKYIGKKLNLKWTTSNDKVVSVEEGKISTISDGNATITVENDDFSRSIDIISTSLITNKPKTYDFKKKYLPCDKYTEEENNKFDEILEYRAHQVGYKTRASAVEVARFLTLEFPYRINYFYETGRLTQSNKIDGEGRYYHKGLYLNSSRYSSITKSTSKPKIWGCSLYDAPAKRNIDNGLDCSGFVSWVLLNAGFDVGDLGAGFSNVKNLTSIGKLIGNTTTLMNSGKIKVGDLLHNNTGGGHIAIIVGIDKENYYVAQALWYDEIGVIITKETKSSLLSKFPHVVLMDTYYKEDGELTNMWY